MNLFSSLNCRKILKALIVGWKRTKNGNDGLNEQLVSHDREYVHANFSLILQIGKIANALHALRGTEGMHTNQKCLE